MSIGFSMHEMCSYGPTGAVTLRVTNTALDLLGRVGKRVLRRKPYG